MHKKLPKLTQSEKGWVLESEIGEGIIYEMAFDGTDSDAEIIERATSLSFLGDATEKYPEPEKCSMTGKLTTRRVLLSKSY